MTTITKIGIIDDHHLFANALATLINKHEEFVVSLIAHDEKDLQQKISKSSTLPSILLMDINLGTGNGIDLTRWVREAYPTIHVLGLSMDNNHATIIKMLKAGACGYLLKDMEPEHFIFALKAVESKGMYHTDLVSTALLSTLTQEKDVSLKDTELTLLQYVCTEMTYKEIAGKMFLSPKTIDKYRESLFGKFKVKSRTALAIMAVRKGYVKLE